MRLLFDDRSCLIILAAMWACALGTLRHVPHLAQGEAEAAPLTPRHVWREIRSTLRNRNYVVLLVGYFFFEIACE